MSLVVFDLDIHFLHHSPWHHATVTKFSWNIVCSHTPSLSALIITACESCCPTNPVIFPRYSWGSMSFISFGVQRIRSVGIHAIAPRDIGERNMKIWLLWNFKSQPNSFRMLRTFEVRIRISKVQWHWQSTCSASSWCHASMSPTALVRFSSSWAHSRVQLVNQKLNVQCLTWEISKVVSPCHSVRTHRQASMWPWELRHGTGTETES